MKITKKILLLLCLTFLTPVKDGHAFIIIPNTEAIQQVMETIDATVVSPSMSIMQKARKYEQKIRKETTGKSGKNKDAFKQYKLGGFAGSGGVKDFGSKTVDYLSDVSYNPILAKDILAKEQVVKYGGGSDTATYNTAEAKSKEIMYEDLASLYAIALTTHARLLQKQENEESNEDLNQRDLIQATTLKAVETAQALSVNLLMEASMAHYRRNLQVSTIKKFEEEDPLAAITDESSNETSSGDKI